MKRPPRGAPGTGAAHVQIRGSRSPRAKGLLLPCPRREPQDRVEGERRVNSDRAIGMQEARGLCGGTGSHEGGSGEIKCKRGQLWTR